MVPGSMNRIFRDEEFKLILQLVLFFQLFVFSFYYLLDLTSIPLALLATALLYAIKRRKILRNRHVKKLFLFFNDRKPDKNIEKYVNGIVVVYSLLLVFLLLTNKIFLLPEQMIFFGLLGAVYLGRGGRFIRDWVPFIVLILGYEAMRGFADNLGSAVHYKEMIYLDRLIFGAVPSEYLQSILYTPGVIQWYDVIATAVYILHFSAPLMLAYYFWCEGKNRLFKHMSATIIMTSYIGLMIFILYPAAPPWLAYEHGEGIVVQKVLKNVTDVWDIGVLWTIYQFMNPNPVAAMPSLHAAYPWIVYLYVYRRWKTHALIVFPVIMAFSLIYLGEHYFVDVLAGFILATIVYFFVDRVFRKDTE